MTDRLPEASRFRRPESVLVIIHTAELECLLLERVDPAGFWQSVTGTLHWEEAPADCAVREVHEETGIAATELVDGSVARRFPILPQWRSRYAPDVAENLEHLWYLELPERKPVVINPAEHRAFRWLPLDYAIEKATSWTNRLGLEQLGRNRAGG